MALLPHRRHGNVPQKCSTLLPPTTGGRVQLALETVSSENSSTVLNLQLCSTGLCEMETVSTIKITEDSPSSKKPHRPAKDVAALLKTIRIHPEAQRILGNSCVPVVTLERLRFQFVSHLQPVVSLMRLPCQTQAHLHDNVSCSDPQQNGSSQNEADILEIRAESPQPPRPEESSEISQSEETLPSWTEPYCPEDSPPSGEPEHDSLGFDCESNPDQPYILFESGSEEWDQEFKTDSDIFYLDPDLEQTLVIELNPQPDDNQDGYIDLVDESEATCEVVDIVEMDTVVEYQTVDLCCPQEEEDSAIQQPGPAVETQEMESEDFCAVCLTGGDLLCCDRCPKVYHLACHIPPLISSPLGDWVCTLCRTDLETFHCENTHCCGVKAPYTLSHQDQRRCEKLTLLLYCHTLSAPFHEPVSRLARNYYQIIKRPMDLSVIRRKLNESNTLHYFTAQQFVDDVLLMFKNCATFNYPDSEVAQAGRNLEMFFLSKLKEMFPERTFQSTSHERTDRTDRTRCHWLRRKRTEKNRKKRYVFSGKKYYL